jgi:hypothetical protein
VRRVLVGAVGVVTAGLLTACAGSSGGQGGAGVPDHRVGGAASCVAPTLTVNPARSGRGDTVQVTGEWFAADCYDTGQAGTPPPLTSMTIEFRQGHREWTVASGVDASGGHYTFTVPIRVPADVHPGPARIAVKGYGSPARLHVRSR